MFTLRQILRHRFAFQRPTITVFLDTRTAFDSADRSAICHCLLRNGASEKYVSVIKELCRHMPGMVRVCDQLSPSFVVPSGVRQGCLVSPYLFNFVTEDVLLNALSRLLDGEVELLSGNKV